MTSNPSIGTIAKPGSTSAPAKPVTPTPAKPPAPSTPPLTHDQQSVYDLMDATLASWGLSSLSDVLRGFIVKGDTNPDTLALELSQTKEYKQRFAANALRVKNGLSELKPAEYIALEAGYRQVLQAYGMPAGFYDSQSDFEKFIANDMSVNELQSRVQVAHDQYTAAPEYVKNLWQQYFGTKGDAIAAILDPNTATAIIQDRGQQVALGGAAAESGFSINQQRAQQFQQQGVTLDQARKAYQQIAQSMPTDQSIAHRFGTTFTQAEEENGLVLDQAAANQKRQTLYNEEQSLFKGGIAADTNSLGVSQSY